jgi:uncharacterized membrane protein
MSPDNFTLKQFITGAGLLFSLALFVSFFTPAYATAQTKSGTGGESTFMTDLMNIEAAVHETFRYNATLHNGTSQTRIYELKAAAPDGWNVVFNVRGIQVTSIRIDGNQNQSLSIEIHPAYSAEPSKYKIPITATTPNETLELNLEAVVRGAYGIELTTPTGLLSDNITEGKQKEIHLVVRNTGTLPLNDISVSAQTPSAWTVTFEPSKIEQLTPGKTIDVVAKLTVPDKTIAGDYVTTFTASNTNSSSKATFRMTVKTSLLSGWIGILVILLAVGLVFYLIRKYGRR